MKKRSIKIALITVCVHSLYFFMFPTSLNLKDRPKKSRELRVVTKEIVPPRSKSEIIAKAHLSPETTQNRKKDLSLSSFLPEAPPPKKVVKKTPQKKKATPRAKSKPKPKPKQTATPTPKTTKSVRGKLEKNVAKIQSKNPVKKPAPKPHSSPQTQGESKHAYLQKISTQLRDWLTLPEKGAVKLTITVQANGKIVSIVPLSQESEKNLEYLKCVLPSLKLPAYDEKEEVTFTITFCDD